MIETVRASLRAKDFESALDVLVRAWRDNRAIALAEAIDAVDAADATAAFAGTRTEWLDAARVATTHRERGALLKSLLRRPADEIQQGARIASHWQDPRLSTRLLELMRALPFSGQSKRQIWRDLFEIVRLQRDVRFVEHADALIKSWNVNSDTQRFMSNRLREAIREIREIDGISAPVLEAGLTNQLVGLTADLRAQTAPPATEEDLLAAIYEHPDDDAPRAVYADWLQEKADPRGELIVLQLRGGDPAREKALLAKHKRAWLGPLARVLGGDIEYRRGFVVKATSSIGSQRDAEQYGSLPAWATLEDLELGGGAGGTSEQAPWARFASPVMLAHLRHLFIPGVGVEWLDETPRCPPHLTVYGGFENRQAWLDRATRSPLERLTFRYGSFEFGQIECHFSRDAERAFTRLDIEIRRKKRIKSLNVHLERRIDTVQNYLGKLPQESLSHFETRIEIAGKRREIRRLVEAASTKLRATRR